MGAMPPESGGPPMGLSPRVCQTVYDHMRLCNSAMLSVSQTAGFIASSAVVATRHCWLDFVKFESKDKKPNAAKLAGIAKAPIDTSGLFGVGMEDILARQVSVDTRLPALK